MLIFSSKIRTWADLNFWGTTQNIVSNFPPLIRPVYGDSSIYIGYIGKSWECSQYMYTFKLTTLVYFSTMTHFVITRNWSYHTLPGSDYYAPAPLTGYIPVRLGCHAARMLPATDNRSRWSGNPFLGTNAIAQTTNISKNPEESSYVNSIVNTKKLYRISHVPCDGADISRPIFEQ